MPTTFRFALRDLPPEAESLRAEVREFLRAELGGHERSLLARYVVLEEMLAAGAPVRALGRRPPERPLMAGRCRWTSYVRRCS